MIGTSEPIGFWDTGRRKTPMERQKTATPNAGMESNWSV